MFMAVNFNDKTLEFYDTFHSSGSEIFETVLAYISEEMSFTDREFNKNQWKCINKKETPRQTDGYR